ncbi:MAG TPA: DUF1579 domain-containing protein [Planctomycetota bacterium]|nr:DUF1579 domain-containing protein [Planctomycetota bacterium]
MSRMSARPGPSALVCALLGAVALGAASGCASGEEETPPPSAPHELTAEEQQAFEDYLEQQQPGEHHRVLEPLVGRFEAQVLHWMAPGTEPSSSTGVLESSWTLGGRFVFSRFTGESAGQPFEGQGLLGYDTVQEKYVGNWADSMGTFLWPVATGDFDENGDVLTMRRVMNDPMTGELVRIRDVTTIVDADHITYEMFATHPGSDEFRMLEARYTRS